MPAAEFGWGEGHISPGSSSETREGGWTFCREHAAAVVGKNTTIAKAMIVANMGASKVAATALLTAIEMLEDHPLLRIDREVRLPLLTPFNSSTPKEIAEEVERRLNDGFRTFKIKVGKDADDDGKRVKTIQQAIGGRATLRLGCQIVPTVSQRPAALSPRSTHRGSNCSSNSCDSENWEANSKVAKASSPVPIMLDGNRSTLSPTREACWGH